LLVWVSLRALLDPKSLMSATQSMVRGDRPLPLIGLSTAIALQKERAIAPFSTQFRLFSKISDLPAPQFQALAIALLNFSILAELEAWLDNHLG
jgi:hypothetical protein